jgi:hypothetical protein
MQIVVFILAFRIDCNVCRPSISGISLSNKMKFTGLGVVSNNLSISTAAVPFDRQDTVMPKRSAMAHIERLCVCSSSIRSMCIGMSGRMCGDELGEFTGLEGITYLTIDDFCFTGMVIGSALVPIQFPIWIMGQLRIFQESKSRNISDNRRRVNGLGITSCAPARMKEDWSSVSSVLVYMQIMVFILAFRMDCNVCRPSISGISLSNKMKFTGLGVVPINLSIATAAVPFDRQVIITPKRSAMAHIVLLCVCSSSIRSMCIGMSGRMCEDVLSEFTGLEGITDELTTDDLCFTGMMVRLGSALVPIQFPIWIMSYPFFK